MLQKMTKLCIRAVKTGLNKRMTLKQKMKILRGIKTVLQKLLIKFVAKVSNVFYPWHLGVNGHVILGWTAKNLAMNGRHKGRRGLEQYNNKKFSKLNETFSKRPKQLQSYWRWERQGNIRHEFKSLVLNC